MSGFEVAGIVLGAFPLAISALEKYREVATRLGLFYKIKLEYRRCSNDLEFHQLALTRHLKQLLLPLVVDDDKIQELIKTPGGEAWKDASVEELLQKRLKDSYKLYLEYIKGMERVMDDLVHELALDSKSVQEKLADTTKPSSNMIRMKSALTKDGRLFQLYRLKFSNGETVRKKLFAELQDYNDKLEKLLESSDRESQLVQQRAVAKQTMAIDSALCTFWIQAAKLFKALAIAWNCRCSDPHSAQLLLQHRQDKEPEFEVVFMKSLPSRWEVKRTRIAQGGDMVSASSFAKETVALSEKLNKLTIHEPKHHSSQPIKSAMKGKDSITATKLLMSTPSITLTAVQVLPHLNAIHPISDLCGALNQPDGSCCGYLPLADDDTRYYVYAVSSQRTETVPTITLDQIIRGAVLPPPTRRQRYTLSLILASSFLQLIDTPWLTSSFAREEIAFSSNPKDPNVFLLDQPHVARELVSKALAGRRAISLTQSLDQLGILLLELSFGKALAEQALRQAWPQGESDKERMVFDVMAARDWMCSVNEEAGPDYSEAVAWCLGGNRSTPPEQWRQYMLRKVVQPLQRCRDYIASGGTG